MISFSRPTRVSSEERTTPRPECGSFSALSRSNSSKVRDTLKVCVSRWEPQDRCSSARRWPHRLGPAHSFSSWSLAAKDRASFRSSSDYRSKRQSCVLSFSDNLGDCKLPGLVIDLDRTSMSTIERWPQRCMGAPPEFRLQKSSGRGALFRDVNEHITGSTRCARIVQFKER